MKKCKFCNGTGVVRKTPKGKYKGVKYKGVIIGGDLGKAAGNPCPKCHGKGHK